MTKQGRYSLWVIGASIVYALSIAGSAWVLRNNSDLSLPMQVLLALGPIVPGAVAVWANFRQINALDEFIRKVHLESLAIAAAGTAFLTIAYGSLEAAGFPRLTMFYVAPLMAAIWIASIAIQMLRHTKGGDEA